MIHDPEDLAGAPQAVLDAALPPLEVPGLSVTYHFLSGTQCTVTAPAAAFFEGADGIDRILHNGVRTQICRAHVTHIETRETTIKIKQKAGQK